MAESQKNASASVSLKEKNLLLDLDIGKDFLSSWKSIAVQEEDAMDFDFAPVSKGKKKIFGFDKADMDFNLDGDFGKISSFNLDMSDLDISSPPKKDGKSKELSKEKSSSGTNKGKTDCFTFAFEFDELGSFNFESSLAKEGSKALENKDNFESSPSGTGCQDKEDSSNMNKIEIKSTLDNDSQKLSAPRTTIDFDIDYQVGTADLELERKKCPYNDSSTSKLPTAIEEGPPDKAKPSSDPIITSQKESKIRPSVKSICPDQVDLEACVVNNAVPDFSSNTLSNNEPIVGNSTELQDKADSVYTDVTVSIGEQDGNEISMANSSSIKHSTSGISNQFESVALSEKNNGENIQDGIEIHVQGNMERTELGQVNSFVENSCMPSVISAPLPDIPTSSENQKPASEIPEFLSVSRPVDNLMSEKAIVLLDNCSGSLIQSVKGESRVQKASPTQTSVSLFNCKKMGFTQPSLVEGARDWKSISNDKKLASLSLEHSKTLRRELPQKWSEESCEGPKICGGGSKADGVQHERNMNNFSTGNMDAVKAKSALRQSEKSMEGLDTLSLSIEINRKTSQNKANPSMLVADVTSPATMKNTSSNEHRISTVESDQRNPTLHGLKNSILKLELPKFPSLKGVSSSGNIGKTSVLSRKLPARSAPSADLQKETLSSPSLKRKTIEECNLDLIVLNPSKRFSQSPSKRRNVVETSERVLDKKVQFTRKFNEVSNHDSIEDHCIKYTENFQLSTFDTPRDKNISGPAMSFSMENDSNIKQAEAYSKGLDDICNMLRKKHEEAKEILVRSIVNSNKFLMLNQSLFKEKISFEDFFNIIICLFISPYKTSTHCIDLHYTKHSSDSEIFWHICTEQYLFIKSSREVAFYMKVDLVSASPSIFCGN